ncbi:uncharacterized protein [Aristolochia californica]|uniref:uncharacterized protein n=1 Tax=Aristolochia californica TaxID=171875 RepID=UPI0035D772CB
MEYRADRLNKAANALSRRLETLPLLYAINQPRFILLDLVKEENASNSVLLDMHKQFIEGAMDSRWTIQDSLIYYKFLFQPSSLYTMTTLMKAMKTSIVAYADISMDFVEGLPQSLGKSILFVDVDRFSMYAHFIPMAHPYTTSRVAHIFLRHIVRLHGIPESIVSDPNDVFTSTFCHELFHLYYTKLKFSSSYHPQIDSQTESTPFSILYGRDPPLLLSYTLGSTRVDSIDQALIERDQVLKNISDRLLKSQVRMKDFYDEGQQDIIYKEVAYQLQLPTTAKLHDVFHVSLLKPFKGLPPSLIPSLPPVDNGWVILTPATVLCANRINNQWEILVQWKDIGQEAATWEQLANFKLVYPTYELEDKLFLQRGGGGVGGCRC